MLVLAQTSVVVAGSLRVVDTAPTGWLEKARRGEGRGRWRHLRRSARVREWGLLGSMEGGEVCLVGAGDHGGRVCLEMGASVGMGV